MSKTDRIKLNYFGPRILLLAAALLISAEWSAQSKSKLTKQANALFSEKKYWEAYSLYNRLYDKEAKKETLLKMAECNYYMESYATAQEYYSLFFKDTLVTTPLNQYENFAKTSKITGKINLAAQAYSKVYKADQSNTAAKYNAEMCQLFLDSASSVKVFNLDSNYNCITVDGTESLDSMAAPHIYIWDLGDGALKEGLVVEHCYKNEGLYKISLSIRDRKNGDLKYNDTSLTVKINHSILNFTSPKQAKPYFFTGFGVSDTTIANCTIQEYFWQMGDGIIHCGKKIKHKYSDPRIYYPKLTVIARDSEGNLRLFSSARSIEIGNTLVPFKESSIYNTDEGK